MDKQTALDAIEARIQGEWGNPALKNIPLSTDTEEDILWIIKEVDHPFVGACVDTVNAWHMGENPMEAIENLSPVAFTNHFRDNLIEFHRDGFKVKGVATGDGDIDMEKAYELIKINSPTNRINIETDMGISIEDKETALRLEIETVKRCIDYCRNVLNIGRDKLLKTQNTAAVK